jgi:hypothetical protein
MKAIKQRNILKNKISDLEDNRNIEKIAIQQQYCVVKKSLSINNIVEQGATEFYDNVTHKNNLLPIVLKLVGGYLSKKVMAGNSKKLTKNLLGYGVQFVTSQLISKMTNK